MRLPRLHAAPLRLIPLFAGLCLVLAASLPAAAQNPFAPRVTVNDRVITEFEVQQRALFLRLFNTPGDLEEEAINRLIEERLQLEEARRMGVRITAEQIRDGMEEFAARAELTAEEFVEAVGEAGIAPESFMDFVEAGLAWREVMRMRFGGRINITDVEVDRALSLTAQRGGTRVLLSEVVLPDTPETAAQAREIAAQVAQITSFGAFADAARRYSAAESAAGGGQLDWLPLANLPDAIQPILLRMQPGQVTPPIPAGGAIVLFQLRGIDDGAALPPASIAVEYARALVPGAGTAEAEAEVARLRARADTCRDLAALLRTPGEEAFVFETRPLSEVPTDVAIELAKLDENEISTNLRQGNAVVVLMLCARTPGGELRPSRSNMRERLTDRRFSALSDALMAELMAAAEIRRP